MAWLAISDENCLPQNAVLHTIIKTCRMERHTLESREVHQTTGDQTVMNIWQISHLPRVDWSWNVIDHCPGKHHDRGWFTGRWNVTNSPTLHVWGNDPDKTNRRIDPMGYASRKKNNNIFDGMVLHYPQKVTTHFVMFIYMCRFVHYVIWWYDTLVTKMRCYTNVPLLVYFKPYLLDSQTRIAYINGSQP